MKRNYILKSAATLAATTAVAWIQHRGVLADRTGTVGRLGATGHGEPWTGDGFFNQDDGGDSGDIHGPEQFGEASRSTDSGSEWEDMAFGYGTNGDGDEGGEMVAGIRRDAKAAGLHGEGRDGDGGGAVRGRGRVPTGGDDGGYAFESGSGGVMDVMVPPRVEGSRANEGRTGHYGALDAAANGDGGSFGAGTKNVVKPPNEKAKNNIMSIPEDDMKRLNQISRILRGSGSEKVDSSAAIAQVNDIAKSQLGRMQDIQKMYQDGNEEGLASAIKSTIGDVSTMIEVSEEAREIHGLGFPETDSSVDTTTADENPLILDTVPNSQWVELFPTQVIDQVVDLMQGLVQMLEEINVTPAISRKDNLFSHKRSDEPFQSSFGNEQFPFQKPSGAFDPGSFNFAHFKTTTHHKKFGTHLHFPKLSAENGANRRLLEAVSLRNEKRTNELPVCKATCEMDNEDCTCKRLFGCVNSMTDYDLSLIFAKGYIVTDPTNEGFADFTVNIADLDLFDVDSRITETIHRIRSLTSDSSNCGKVLDEFHSACDPSEESCSNPNDQSFQLSVDQVCDGVNTPTKLLFEVLGDEFDGFDDVPSPSTNRCGSVAYTACADFVEVFDDLYEAMPSDWPSDAYVQDFNPMRRTHSKPAHIESYYTVQFPIGYLSYSSTHGFKQFSGYSMNYRKFPSYKQINFIEHASTGKVIGVNLNVPPFAGHDGVFVELQSQDCDFANQNFILDGSGSIRSPDHGRAFIASTFVWKWVHRDDGTITSTEDPNLVLEAVAGQLKVKERRLENSNQQWNVYSVFQPDFSEPESHKEFLKICDTSMSLLLGSSTSLGTLRAITELVTDKGPERMPGTCCLDTPTNSQFFGSYYNPKLEVNNQRMECQNYGPWHLGISPEACWNANGQFFRTPCVTLKECIDGRAEFGDGYSKAFEDFATGLAISDATKEDECRNARKELGFDADHPFDTEVCQEFNQYQCNDFFDSVDSLAEQLVETPDFGKIEYEDIDYGDDPPLTFTKTPIRSVFEEPIFGANKGSLAVVESVKKGLQRGLSVQENILKISEIDDTCESSFPEVLCGIGCVNNLIFHACKLAKYISKSILQAAIWISETAIAVLESEHDEMTLSDSDKHDGYLYSKATFNNMKNSDKWTHDSLEIMNRNIMTQHTEMREDLQDRHQDMVNDVNKHVTTVGNHLGEYISALSEMILQHHKTLFESLGANATLTGDASWATVPTPDRIYVEKNHNSIEGKDIGDVGVPGSAIGLADGSWAVKGSGSDIWGNDDEFHYVNFGKVGDITLELHVDNFDAVQEWAKGGLMIRDTLETDSAHFSSFVTGSNGLQNVYRENTSFDSISSQSGLYELRTDLKGPKCPEGLEVSESECWSAALEAVGGDYPITNDHLYVGDWSYTPCGCFIWGTFIDYDRGVVGECNVHNFAKGMVCRKSASTSFPVWLQIKKVGNQLSSAYKYEVVDDWTQLGSTTTINFSSDDFYVGIAVASQDNSNLATLSSSELKMIAPNDEGRRRLEGSKPRFALDVQWPNGNILDELVGLKKDLGVTAEQEKEYEGASGGNRVNRRKIIGSRNVLEDGEDVAQSVKAVGAKVDGIEGKVDGIEGKVDVIEADMKQMKDMMSELIEKLSGRVNVRT